MRKTFKTLLLLITAKRFQGFRVFSSQWSSQNYVGDFLNFEFRFLNFLSKISLSLFYPMEKPKTSIIWKTNDRRAKRGEIWVSRVVLQHVKGTFGRVPFNVILGAFGAFAIFAKTRFPKQDFYQL